MDLPRAIRDFVEQTRSIMERLQSSEGDAISRTDLHILEVQLYLLGKEVERRKMANATPSGGSASRIAFPPFVKDADE